MFHVALALDEAAKVFVLWVILYVYDEHRHLLMREFFLGILTGGQGTR